MTESVNALKIEASSKLRWLSFEIDRMSKNGNSHPIVVRNLTFTANEIYNFIRLIDINSTTPNDDLGLEILRKSKVLWGNLDKAAIYVSMIQRENNEDRLIRELVLDLAQKNGIPIKDLIVSLTSPFSCTPYDPVPVVTGYPWDVFTLIDSAAFFHEIGHIVFDAYHDIEIKMKNIVKTFFLEYKRRNSGPSNKRNGDIRRATEKGIEYWNEDRLNELFADIYAAYISGPVFYETVINMAFTAQSAPFELNDFDEHPPPGIRMEVCKKMCSNDWHDEKEFIKLINLNEECVSNKKIPTETQIICSSDLTNELVKSGELIIYDKLPKTIRFKPPQTNQDILSDKMPYLLKLLYEGLVVRLGSDRDYENWEIEAIRNMIRFVNKL